MTLRCQGHKPRLSSRLNQTTNYEESSEITDSVCFLRSSLMISLIPICSTWYCDVILGLQTRMIDVLQYFGYGDWQLCSLACQVLWNFCASAADVQEVLGHKETEKLIYVLEEFLDDDSYFNNPEVFGECDPDTKDVVYQLWEDFAFVATKLLDRIEENTTSLPVVPAS